MCGIGGVVQLNGQPVSESVLRSMASLLGHRGPDGQDVFTDGAVGLAHSRLAIFDLSDRGVQPMSFLNERYWITYNGEIYNFLEIRETLEKKYKFASDTDTEVILAAFSEWGVDCVDKFNGMFAFAIWDAKEKFLHLFRDRFGVKPLYYYFDGRIFAFASEIKGFLAIPEIDLRYDSEGLSTVLAYCHGSEGIETTAFQSVKKLLPGFSATLKISEKKPRIRRWWRLIDHLPHISVKPQEQVEHFSELFLDACRLRMRSDVPIGICLSGGLDSSSVFSTVNLVLQQSELRARISSERQIAFILRFAKEDNEEQDLAEALAKDSGAKVEVLDERITNYLQSESSTVDMLNQLRRLTYDFEGIGFIFPAQWQLYQEVQAKGIRVTLDGHGADECLYGYPEYSEHYALESFCTFVTAAQTLNGISDNPHTWKEIARQNHLPENVEEQEIMGPFEPSWLAHPSAVSSYCRASPQEYVSDVWNADQGELDGMDHLFRVAYFQATCGFLQWVLRTYDLASMTHGVESRAPFLDWRLFCFAFALPSNRKIANGYGKRILRESMVGIVPDAIRLRQRKKGLHSPLNAMLSGPFMGELDKIICSSDFANDYPWDGTKVSEFWQNEDISVSNKVKMLWPLIQAHFLADTFREKKARVGQIEKDD